MATAASPIISRDDAALIEPPTPSKRFCSMLAKLQISGLCCSELLQPVPVQTSILSSEVTSYFVPRTSSLRCASTPRYP